MFYARWTHKSVPARTPFIDRLRSYVAEWAFTAHEQNIVTVDAKSAPSAKHTASRTSWLHTREE
jgi:hypothetical protein